MLRARRKKVAGATLARELEQAVGEVDQGLRHGRAIQESHHEHMGVLGGCEKGARGVREGCVSRTGLSSSTPSDRKTTA